MTDRELAVAAWESLFRAQVGVIRVLASEFPTRTMSLNEYDVLFNLSLQPNHRARLRDINELVLLSQPSVSRLIDRLVARGLVSKHPDPTDKRQVIVALTADARKVLKETRRRRDAWMSVRVGHLDPEEQAILLRASEILTKVANE